MKIAAIALLVIGTIVGALGGAKLPSADPLIAGAGLLLLAAGAALLRLSKGGGGAEAVARDDEAAAALRSISTVPREAAELARDASKLELPQVIERINRINAAHLQPVGDATPTLLDNLGSRIYAELMGSYASGERLITRAWSAAADDHRPECLTSLERAAEEFRQAGEVSDRIQREAGEAASSSGANEAAIR